MLDPENCDRLTRLGGVLPRALANPMDYEDIVQRCSEEFALELFRRTACSYRLLSRREPVSNAFQGIARDSLDHAAEFLKIFVERRLRRSAIGVVCDPGEFPPIAQTAPQSYHLGTGLPDPVAGVFTTQPWPAETTHSRQFPHLVLLAQKEEPRVYTVLPMDAAFLNHEETAFEVARLFAAYGEVDLCLCLSSDRCIYIRKNCTYRRSTHRPTGGAVAHRSLTAPRLFRHYSDTLRCTFNEQPGLFAFSDEFDGDTSLFTADDFIPVEPMVSLESDARNRISEEVGRAVSDFMALFHREWDEDVDHVRVQVGAWLKAMKIRSKGVHVVNRRDMGTLLCRNPSPSEFVNSPLFRALDSALDVMENSLKRAGVYKMVNSLLQPVYTASHIGYLRMLYQISRVAGLPDSESYWNRIQGWILPAALTSSITLLRLEVFRRIEPLLCESISATTRKIDAVGSRVIKHLDLFRKIHERGPMWLGMEGRTVTVMPAVLIRLDEEGEFHSEDGPAIIDPDGTKVFAVHGQVQ